MALPRDQERQAEASQRKQTLNPDRIPTRAVSTAQGHEQADDGHTHEQ